MTKIRQFSIIIYSIYSKIDNLGDLQKCHILQNSLAIKVELLVKRKSRSVAFSSSFLCGKHCAFWYDRMRILNISLELLLKEFVP